ncbi:MAG: hypothetical protein AAGE03_11220 [Pseudomonadota bacterium]
MTRFLAVLPLLVSPALAQTVPAEPDAARALMQSFAGTMDADQDGEISSAELVDFSDQVFQSLDTDGSGGIAAEELIEWEFGVADMAAFRGREQAYATAITFVHDLFDTDNDEAISPTEHREGILRSRDYADVDRDGRLVTAEFLRNFIYSMAIRSALIE